MSVCGVLWRAQPLLRLLPQLRMRRKLPLLLLLPNRLEGGQLRLLLLLLRQQLPWPRRMQRIQLLLLLRLLMLRLLLLRRLHQLLLLQQPSLPGEGRPRRDRRSHLTGRSYQGLL